MTSSFSNSRGWQVPSCLPPAGAHDGNVRGVRMTGMDCKFTAYINFYHKTCQTEKHIAVSVLATRCPLTSNKHTSGNK